MSVIVLSSLAAMILGFSTLNWNLLTKHQAETAPHHPDPSLRTRTYKHAYDVFFTILLDLQKNLPRWKIVQHDRQAGTIQMERLTPTFRFVDDIQINLTKIDHKKITLNIRSVSRVGKGDFGQNARNIREFLDALDQHLGAFTLDSLASSGLFEGLPQRLMSHVNHLALDIGERHFARKSAYDRAADYIHTKFRESGHHPEFKTFRIQDTPLLTTLRAGLEARDSLRNYDYKNIVAINEGLNEEIIVVGAHYDTVAGSPGADDNASGVAVLLEVARLLQHIELKKTVLFVAFANEEAPFFGTRAMGSDQFLRSSDLLDKKIHFMISLEMLGYYSDDAHSQIYPPFLSFFYPDQANFIAVIGNLASHKFVKVITQTFRNQTDIPTESLSAPTFVPGVSLSDQFTFWKAGIPAVMITDTAYNRNPNYHTQDDLPASLNYEKMSEVTKGVFASLIQLGKGVGLKKR